MPIPPTAASSQRLLSLDFMRGLIMVLLILESTGLYEHLSEATDGNFFNAFFQQFFHHPWITKQPLSQSRGSLFRILPNGAQSI